MSDEFHVAVTATRAGLSDHQLGLVRVVLMSHMEGKSLVLHHGMCRGGDTDIHHVARSLGIRPPNHRIEGHPGHGRNGSSPTRVESDVDVRHEPAPYLTRDRTMVDVSGLLIGCPRSVIEESRGSGTWYTIRYARKLRRPTELIFPSGAISWEGIEC